MVKYQNIDPRKLMIIVKDEIKTLDIDYLEVDDKLKKVNIKFYGNRKIYSYNKSNVLILHYYLHFTSSDGTLFKDGDILQDVEDVYVFKHKGDTYYHVISKYERMESYYPEEIECSVDIEKIKQRDVWKYIREISGLSKLSDEKGEQLLPSFIEKVDENNKKAVLSKYIGLRSREIITTDQKNIIFPFGLNKSQYIAVKNALQNDVSFIQGPPGTGKTQTILNIVANLLYQNKTVLIVSNNNSATKNVLDKLSDDRYNLDFTCAFLGKKENKMTFFENQKLEYPNMDGWKIEKKKKNLIEVNELTREAIDIFDIKESIAKLETELAQLETEYKHFMNYYSNNIKLDEAEYLKRKGTSTQVLYFYNRVVKDIEDNRKYNIFKKLINFIFRGIKFSFYELEDKQKISLLQKLFLETKSKELNTKLKNENNRLYCKDTEALDKLQNLSYKLLMDKLASKYGRYKYRDRFEMKDLRSNGANFVNEYPIILSTTFSSIMNIENVIFDYLIMDESSQVDIVTGAMSLSCAKNVVIVGDSKQLPNVVTNEDKKIADEFFNRFSISEAYRFTNSFLDSMSQVFPNAPNVLLREHYRCHPKIINFCNQKFYNNNLLIMTEDHGEQSIKAIKTVQGNHARGHFNQREIDVIINEVLPNINADKSNIGIMAPYNDQVDALKKQIPDIEIDTIHKYQGREKDVIILSTVENEISDFVEGPNILNVAVSRAKKEFILVTVGNESAKRTNISDLIDYIEYNNFEIKFSSIRSIFDYLYSAYSKERIEYIKRYRNISEYDSEVLMYTLAKETLDKEYEELDIAVHYPLYQLFNTKEMFFNQEEINFIDTKLSHVDILIYSKTTKNPILAVEIDGYEFHKEGTTQYKRDQIKNHIFDKAELPLIRFNTTESKIKEKLEKKLRQVYYS